MYRVILGIMALLITPHLALAQTTKINVGYGPGSAWAALWIAKDKGIFAKHGLDANLVFLATGQYESAGLIAGTVDIVGNNPIQLLLADESGAELQIVAGADGQTKENPYSGVAVDSEKIKTPADFVGKRIGVPGLQSILHIAIQMWLQVKGVDPAKVTFIEQSMQQMPDLLASGQLDGAVSSPPFLDVLARKPHTNVIHFTAELPQPNFMDAFYMSTRPYIEAHPQIIAAFRDSIREATDMIIKDPELIRPELVTYLKLTPEQAKLATLPNYFSEVTPAMTQFWIDAAKEFGVIKGTVTVSDALAK